MDKTDNPLWWVLEAACFPDDGPAVELAELFVDAGKSISAETYTVCEGCPVRFDCLEWAYDQNIASGYYGGISYGVRRKYDYDDLVALIKAGKIGRGGRRTD
jgi:adenine-specific DNA glycosylase